MVAFPLIVFNETLLDLTTMEPNFGAVAAGQKAALIRRVSKDVLGVRPRPHNVGADLDDVADQLIARHGERTNVK